MELLLPFSVRFSGRDKCPLEELCRHGRFDAWRNKIDFFEFNGGSRASAGPLWNYSTIRGSAGSRVKRHRTGLPAPCLPLWPSICGPSSFENKRHLLEVFAQRYQSVQPLRLRLTAVSRPVSTPTNAIFTQSARNGGRVARERERDRDAFPHC